MVAEFPQDNGVSYHLRPQLEWVLREQVELYTAISGLGSGGTMANGDLIAACHVGSLLLAEIRQTVIAIGRPRQKTGPKKTDEDIPQPPNDNPLDLSEDQMSAIKQLQKRKEKLNRVNARKPGKDTPVVAGETQGRDAAPHTDEPA